MKQNLLRDLVDITLALQENPAMLSKFRAWVNFNKSILGTVFSSGELLRLKHGSVKDVLHTTVAYRISCSCCSGFPRIADFDTALNFEKELAEIDLFLSSGYFFRIRPQWYESNGGYIGAEGFLQCRTCQAIFEISFPEKEANGSISRIF